MYVPRPYMHLRARIRSPRRTASRCSAECAVARRLVDGLPRLFGSLFSQESVHNRNAE